MLEFICAALNLSARDLKLLIFRQNDKHTIKLDKVTKLKTMLKVDLVLFNSMACFTVLS